MSRILLLLLLCSAVALADDSSQIVAKVDGQPITVADLDREISVAFSNRSVEPQARPALREKAKDQLIRRQLVIRYLRDQQQLSTAKDVEIAVDNIKKRLTQREESFADYLKQRQLDESALRRALTWQLSWSRFLEKYLSDNNLERYFEKHRRDFDGTEIRVAHILFAVPETAKAEEKTQARAKAAEVLAQLRANQISFDEAAKQHSAGATRDKGGDIGFISRNEPMPEPFSRAAFALEINQLSEPVETAFGFHIIRCLEIKSGQKRWTDVRPELESGVTEYLFNWAADQARPNAKIE